MFGAFLFVAPKLSGERGVFRRSFAAFTGSRDGTGFHLAIFHTHEHFGRCAQNVNAVRGYEKHVGRRIDRTEHAIDIERRNGQLAFEPLREHHLDDIARGDILFTAEQVLHIRRFIYVGNRFRMTVPPRGSGGDPTRQKRFQPLDTGNRFLITVLQRSRSVHMDVGDDGHRMADVVEYQDGVKKHEEDIVDAEIVSVVVGNVLHQPDCVIGEISHASAGETGEPRKVHRMVGVHDGAEFGDGITLETTLASGIQIAHRSRVAPGPEYQERVRAEKRVARHFLTALHALQEKGIGAPVAYLEIRGNRGFRIGKEGFHHRDDIPFSRAFFQFVKMGSDHEYILLHDSV